MIKKLTFLLSLSIMSLYGKPLDVDQEKDKVVLIHGFMNHHSMSSFNFLLKKTGWDVENYKYASRNKTIEDHASDLVVKLNILAKDDKPINFVAFSLGSLILKAALNHKDCPKEAKSGRIVLIAPPINGSELARYLGKYKVIRKIFGPNAGKQLIETPFKGFDYLGPFPKDIPMLVISGKLGMNPLFPETNDSIVSLEESTLSTPHEQKFVFATHKWICQKLDTINIAKDFLESTS